MEIPRNDYPRPQFRRTHWLNLNGPWQFQIDHGDSGFEQGWVNRELSSTIIVPFCPESVLSGIGHVDFMHAVWYRRTIQIPGEWRGNRVLLHFGAVDYDTTVWVNGREMTRHRGGFTPFTIDLTHVAKPGEEATIVVRARDPKFGAIARGKQSSDYHNSGCHYTRTTGIWQTVWMEPVPMTYLQRARITPDLGRGLFHVEQRIVGPRQGYQIRATLSDAKGSFVHETVKAGDDFTVSLDLRIPADRRRCWSIDDPHLYGLTIELLDAEQRVVDTIDSYAGLRSVTIENKAIKINGKPVFQRLVLDQGYYPDGIMTAPSDQAFIDDIKLSMQAGFNGARLHQKVFEERFLYHCDRLGYIVWGEFPDWGCAWHGPAAEHHLAGTTYITQWLEELERDYSHPSIVGWCPLNETKHIMHDRITMLDDVTRGMFLATKAIDGTRPVLDTSGYSHRVLETDVYDSHDYEQDPATFAANQAVDSAGTPYVNPGPGARGHKPERWSLAYAGQPYFVSEFGGIWWNPDAKAGDDSWGYGERVKNIEEFYARFDGLCLALLDDPNMFGYCYTQLTDTFQEQNGIYRFNRQPKFDLNRIRNTQRRIAAIEKGE